MHSAPAMRAQRVVSGFRRVVALRRASPRLQRVGLLKGARFWPTPHPTPPRAACAPLADHCLLTHLAPYSSQLQTVAMAQPIKLYSFPIAFNPAKALLAIEEKGLKDVEIVNVNLFNGQSVQVCPCAGHWSPLKTLLSCCAAAA